MIGTSKQSVSLKRAKAGESFAGKLAENPPEAATRNNKE
jgi:hypothetical protein